MGTASQKFIINSSGVLTELASISTTVGAGDSAKVVATNASGIVDPTLINAKNTSAGAGDAAKIPQLNSSGILDDTIINATVTSVASKIVKLDGTGKLDVTVMPTGIGADTSVIVASEALAAGDLVNIYNNASVANCRKADAATAGKEAHGFVLASVSNGANATVYFEGSNTQATSLTPGTQFLSPTTAGKSIATAPSAAGQVVQVVGFATSATSFNFQSRNPVVLA